MKPTLQPGISLVCRVPAGKDKTIAFLGEEGLVYATPYLIGDIEHTCRSLILDHAESDEDSVAVEVAIKHLAPTLPGSTIEIAATVTAVEGRKVIFAVTVKDEIDTISSGSHARFVVDKAKTIERLKPREQRVLRMLFFEELETEQVAREVAIAPERVRLVKSRALKHFREIHQRLTAGSKKRE